MVTIYDIAKKANVSPMTVSRVINKSENISPKTKEKVEKVIKELGYIPNTAARSLISKKTKILSLLITDITNPFFTRVARGAEDKAKQMGFQILLCNTDEDVNKESEYVQMLLSTGVDGVLFAPAGDNSRKNLKMLSKNNIPYVLLDRYIDDVKCDYVLGDNYEGARKLTEHLIQQGHKKIALINGPSDISTARERRRGYEETLKLNGFPINEQLISEIRYNNENEAKEAVERLLSLSEEVRPTAIFAANNMIAGNTIKTLRHHSVSVPDDIAIVCFDDLEPITDYNPFLTVASQQSYSYGYMGIQFLIERIEGIAPQDHRKIMLPPEIIIRKSSVR